ncbi:hypothetical protein BJY16_000838 [Actinoplanes octamycinicus]|uniref:DUF4328 domain-containing protein n=1 Tax=Actinoplanes octamycinicus TaxID=135948 RepID=A0A7W7GSA4_9ACTN|nr:DUF4328 domain-containing protein [Actinoplanes octamycinicus]MBB4737379.1 hypothetical protein [Actinoplanes octamycinicus]GIE60336.1 hypothetical protein Aoc01nite_57380 [Actinoplanes octamycinicus]
MNAQQPPPVPDDPRPEDLIPPADPWSAEANTETWPSATPPPAYPATAPAYPAPPPAYPAPAPAYPAYPAPAAAQPAPVPAYSGPPAPYSYPPAYAPGRARSLRGPAILAGTGLAVTLVYSLVLELLSRRGYLGGSDPMVAMSLGYLGVFLFTVVTFLVWLHRASVNLWTTGHRLKWRPGWTIGAWFIPLANLVLPLLVVREIDQRSRDHGPGLFVVWAAAWTVGIVLDGYSSNGAQQFAGLSLITTPVAAIAAILLIRRITADQERLVQPAP